MYWRTVKDCKEYQKSYSSLQSVVIPLVVTTMMMQLSSLEMFVQFPFQLDLLLKRNMPWCLSIGSGGLLKILTLRLLSGSNISGTCLLSLLRYLKVEELFDLSGEPTRPVQSIVILAPEPVYSKAASDTSWIEHCCILMNLLCRIPYYQRDLKGLLYDFSWILIW